MCLKNVRLKIVHMRMLRVDGYHVHWHQVAIEF